MGLSNEVGIIGNTGTALAFRTGASTATERMRIDASGSVGIGVTSPSSYYMDDLVVSAPNEGGITIASDSTSAGAYLAFADGTSGDTAYRGFVHYAHGSDYLRFGTAASERMRLDSSGNVLVGTTSNSVYNDASGTGIALNAGQIQIAGTGTPLYANRQGSDGDIIDFRKDGTTVGSIGNYGGLALDVGKGTTAVLRFRDSLNAIYPAAGVAGGTSDGVTSLGISSGRFKNLYLSGGVYAGAYASFVQGAGGDLFITNTYGSGDLAIESGRRILFKDSGNEAGRFDGNGNLLLGKTSSNFGIAGVELRSSGELIVTRASDVATLNRITSDGTLVRWRRQNITVGSVSVTGSATSYNTSSDQRLKENIVDADDAGSKIDAIQVRKFDWKADGSHQDYGMIAQELQAVAPEAVSGDADSEEMMGVDYSKLVPMLVKEIQSLRNRVAQLEE
jgi:hypothetical protein